MNSSISSSNATQPGASQALTLTAALLLAIGLLRYDSTYAIAPKWYWQMKVEWSAAAGIILAGDSRVYRGLNPDAFSAQLGITCLNFGFSSVGYDDAYLDAIEHVVDHRTRRPVIVLGVTPWSLTPQAIRHNGFRDAIAERRETWFSASWNRRLEGLNKTFRPFDVERLWYGSAQAEKIAQRAEQDNYQQEFRLNGWVASDYHPRNPNRGLQTAKADHDANRCSEVQLALLATRIRKWKSSGWHVLAFRPPSPNDIARLTDELSGFDGIAVANSLTAAGAQWIELVADRYETYDGTHLTANSAQLLSRMLASSIPGGETARQKSLSP